jgi:hypothetical protein
MVAVMTSVAVMVAVPVPVSISIVIGVITEAKPGPRRMTLVIASKG